ncbi:MAG TPA: hypothetical protein VJG32_09620 [Anaerolineae bacterium]|nr:hypothetical protein [Anaerolineae bacterium]
MKRSFISALLLPIIVLILTRSTALPTFQSAAATPTPTIQSEATDLASPLATPSPTQSAGSPASAPTVSPLIWIAVGLLLGGVAVLIARRASPHAQ